MKTSALSLFLILFATEAFADKGACSYAQMKKAIHAEFINLVKGDFVDEYGNTTWNEYYAHGGAGVLIKAHQRTAPQPTNHGFYGVPEERYEMFVGTEFKGWIELVCICEAEKRTEQNITKESKDLEHYAACTGASQFQYELFNSRHEKVLGAFLPVFGDQKREVRTK